MIVRCRTTQVLFECPDADAVVVTKLTAKRVTLTLTLAPNSSVQSQNRSSSNK